ncbi:hypothetical protein F3164_07855 [Streptococcus agalactiae]|nr:hypothetical protein F3159_07935 [Streptococcus agalactiae]KAA8989153.1 hypothetical protein F3164_07855 [Streptococcus agalactiae]KAA9067878.1 hypothetical protein F5J00_07635 [Streptococcus agalactiae]KAA9088259.1 hypothetical protein F5S39_04140 [Streptococcus agalactiae]HEN7936651.1 hypothetical protein [Streptococcus agalactiae]
MRRVKELNLDDKTSERLRLNISNVKYGEKDYLKNTDLAYVVCDKIVDADSIGFVYHGEYETWHFKLLNTEAN